MARVLVVEDDEAICALITEILVEAGLETKCVRTDQSAYAELTGVPTFAALLVDVNLGKGTTGFDVARFARQVDPRLPVIYISGDASQESFRAFGVPDSEFLQKPFTQDQLLQIVRDRTNSAAPVSPSPPDKASP
jgi:DNA-binding NtrC family response regulator